jgi:1-acyl-sn-glycerol-3-phosphate acyltransferase
MMSDTAHVPPPLPGGGVYWHANRGSVIFRVTQAACRIACTTLLDMKVYGADTFPRTGGVLIVCNHQSFLDPLLIGTAAPRALSAMAKSELFKNPLFGWLIRSYGAFPVRQTGSAAGAIKETIDRLQEGRALTIYPEGSRTTDGEIQPFEKGTALVVRKAKVPVVPAAIHGSFEAYPTGTKFPIIRPFRIMFGPPMLLHDQRPDRITAILEQKVRQMYAQLREQDPRYREHAAWAVRRRDRALEEKRRKRERSSVRPHAGG